MSNSRGHLLHCLRMAQLRQKQNQAKSQQLDRFIDELFGLTRRKAESDPFATDVVFGFHKPSGDVTLHIEDTWGFQVKEDGTLIYRKGNHEETYSIPSKAIQRLKDAFHPHYEHDFPEFVLRTGIQGLDGWCDSFTFLGYTFSAWCVEKRSLLDLDRYEEGTERHDDVQQDLTMIDLFQQGCAILQDYGFSITMERFQKLSFTNRKEGNPVETCNDKT